MFNIFLQAFKPISLYLLSMALIFNLAGCSSEEDESQRLSNLVTSTVGPDNSPIIVTTFPIIRTSNGEPEVVELSPSVFQVFFEINNNTDQFLFVTSLTVSVDFITSAGAFDTRSSIFTVGSLDTPDDDDFLPTTITFPFSDDFNAGDSTAAIEPFDMGSFSGPGRNGVIYFSDLPTPEDIGTPIFTYNVEVTFRGFFSETQFTGDATANFTHRNTMTARATD